MAKIIHDYAEVGRRTYMEFVSGNVNFHCPAVLSTNFRFFPEASREDILYMAKVETVFNLKTKNRPIAHTTVSVDEHAREFFKKDMDIFEERDWLTMLEAVNNHNELCKRVFKIAMKSGFVPDGDFEERFPTHS